MTGRGATPRSAPLVLAVGAAYVAVGIVCFGAGYLVGRLVL